MKICTSNTQVLLEYIFYFNSTLAMLESKSIWTTIGNWTFWRTRNLWDNSLKHKRSFDLTSEGSPLDACAETCNDLNRYQLPSLKKYLSNLNIYTIKNKTEHLKSNKDTIMTKIPIWHYYDYMLNFENVIDVSLLVVNFRIMSNMSYLRSKFFL